MSSCVWLPPWYAGHPLPRWRQPTKRYVELLVNQPSQQRQQHADVPPPTAQRGLAEDPRLYDGLWHFGCMGRRSFVAAHVLDVRLPCSFLFFPWNVARLGFSVGRLSFCSNALPHVCTLCLR